MADMCDDSESDQEEGERVALTLERNQPQPQDKEDDDELLTMYKAMDREDPVTRNLKNATQLYAAIQEWRMQPADSYQYKAQAIGILDRFLVDPEPLDSAIFEPTEDLDDYEGKYDCRGTGRRIQRELRHCDERRTGRNTTESGRLYRGAKAQVPTRLATVSKVDFSLCKHHDGASGVDTCHQI